MYFKRLEMHGFKSFVEPAVIDFHEGVTCVVGPNGSGKSNISDAIRWVLGEQSPKMLRANKMEEVIFAGTDSRKSRGMAEVTLVIDNSTGILPIEYSEVAITRRMYRSGESEYLINNNQCRLRDIKELIMDTGIGVEGYSIIGQGKVEQIVSSKPEARREIFEEAAGVVMYKSKKAEAERKLQSANTNLDRVNDIIGEIEGRIDGLKDESIKAKEYLELKERSKELDINITLRTIEKLDASTKEVRDDIDEISKKLEELRENKASIDKELSESRQKNENLEQLSNDARDKHLTLVSEINDITNKSQLDQARLETIDRDVERINDEISELDDKKTRELSNVSELDSEKKELKKSLDVVEENLAEKTNVFDAAVNKQNDIADEIDDLRNEMYHLYQESASKKSEAKSLDSYKTSLLSRKEEIIKAAEDLEKNNSEALKTLQNDEASFNELSSKLAALSEEVKEKENQFNELSLKLREGNKEQNHLEIQLSQYNTRKRTIEEMEANYEGYNGAVKFIMKGALKGINGVVADIITVPKGFEVAIETALGSSMQNIICDTDKSAKEAVNALKENKAGRLTFLPVESIKGNVVTVPANVSKASGFKGLGSELVSCDKKYQGIIDYLLGRTVIVSDMQDAITLSKGVGNIRFVTLDGEVVSPQGAITGGKYKNASANILERKAEISKLEEKILSINSEKEKLASELKLAESELSKLDSEIISANDQYKMVEKEALGIKVKIDSIKALQDQNSDDKEKTSKQLTVIEKDFEAANSQVEELEKEAENAQLRAEEAKEKIEKLLKEQEASKEEVEEASDAITKVRMDKNSWDSKIDAINQLIERVTAAVNDYQSQIEIKKIQLNDLGNEKARLLGAESSADVEQMISERSELEDYIRTVQKERTSLSEKIEEKAREQEEMLDTLNSYQDQKYQLEIKLAKNDTQLDTFKDRLWEEFEISYLQALEMRKDDFAMSTAQKESREIKNRLRELGDVNVGSIEEYKQVSERYGFLTEQREDITSAMDQLQKIVNDMERTIKSKFKSNFDQVVVNFEEIFKSLFGGGHAELRLEDENNPLESGIEIVAQPPGKKLQNINLMSGGEKTMTAIALMFAVLKTTPTPFCILDEVEAALDDANIDRFANYLKNFRDIQFAIVTHQKQTMEHADVLYGVTMPERGISKVLSLRLGDDFDLEGKNN